MHDLNDLRYFYEVVERGGFSAAARSLNIPKSRLSRHIAQLEERLAVRLLQRTTRRLRLTAAGERYFAYCREITATARAAEEAMHQLRAEPAGEVVLSCPVAIAQQELALLLPEFLETWPKVSVHLIVTNRPVDLIREGVDLALRVRTTLDTDAEMVIRRLGIGMGHMVASPRYIQGRGSPEHPDQLAGHDILCFSDTGGEQRWRLVNDKGERLDIMVRPRLCCNDFPVLLEAAARGRGIALLPTVATHDALRRGDLAQVLPNWTTIPGIMHCIYPSRRGMMPAVRALLEFLTQRLPPLYSLRSNPAGAKA